jgi:hypothetical protein
MPSRKPTSQIKNKTRKMKRKEIIAALVIFAAISLIFAHPIFQNLKNWGIHDWDQHLMYNGVPRLALVEFKQAPLWNPYYCGGNVMLANPQSSFLSPLFVFIIIFGEVIGLKLLILAYLMFGLLGMYLLARHAGISTLSSYLSSFVFMLSGIYFMRLTVGHTVWLQIALVPYIFYFYLRSIKQTKYVFLSALFLAFIFLGGGIYPLVFILLFLGFFSALITIKEWDKSKFKYLKNFIIVMILFIFLSSIKLIPMLEFTDNHSYVKKNFQDNDLKKTFETLIFRDVDSRMGYMYDYDINGYGVVWGWHEYHAYIGFLPLMLFLLGAIFLLRNEWPLITISVIFLLIAWGDNSVINIWGFLRQFPFISNLHGSSRFITMFIFSSSLIIGKITSKLENKFLFLKIKKIRINFWMLFVILLVLIIFADLFLVNSKLLEHAFVREPLNVDKQEFTQVTGNKDNMQYPIFLANLGLVDCFERTKPKLKAIPKFDTKTVAAYSNYIGEAYILKNNKSQEITYFSPNKIRVKTSDSGVLVINQNYIKGWKVDNGNIKNVEGLIGIDVEEGEELNFYYLPNSFILGLIISSISLMIFVAWFLRLRRNN